MASHTQFNQFMELHAERPILEQIPKITVLRGEPVQFDVRHFVPSNENGPIHYQFTAIYKHSKGLVYKLVHIEEFVVDLRQFDDQTEQEGA